MTATEHALVEALYRVEGKAEIIGGEIVHLEMSGYNPNYAAIEVVVSLRSYARRARAGRVGIDGLFFLVDLPHRMSFSPDASYFTGPSPGMRFVEGAPDFAVEVRSENDYGPAAERAMAAKRADYFATGTKVVWDVDTQGEDAVRVFRDGDSDRPAVIYRRGQTAEAEPAVPGWTFVVDTLYES